MSLRDWVALAFAAAALQAQGIPGHTLQETIFVPVSGASVTSSTALLTGVAYQLRVAGTAHMQIPVGGLTYNEVDAEYAIGFAFFGFSIETSSCGSPAVDLGVAVNNSTNGASKTPNWGAYNSSHIYTANFTGAGAPISLNFHSCSYAGSQGDLTVQIFRPMGMNFPSNTPPAFTDVSPTPQTFPYALNQSVTGRLNALALASNGTRLYAGTFAGVWRSDDSGTTWRQMTQPQPAAGVDVVPGALDEPDVYDIAVSPANPDIVLVGARNDLHQPSLNGIYRSADGGNRWNLVKQFACSVGGDVTQIVFAPDNPNLVYAAGGCAVGISSNGGVNWSENVLANSASAWHVAVAPAEQPVVQPLLRSASVGQLPQVRRVYALGSDQMWYSTDGGQTWRLDNGLTLKGVGDPAAANSGNSSRVMVVEPGYNQRVLVAVPSMSNGLSFFDDSACGSKDQIPDGTACNTGKRSCGEGSLWLVDFTNFSDPRDAAVWTQLPSPPTYWGVTTPSGNSYIGVTPSGNSFLLFLSDKSHVHVTQGLPTSLSDWHRVDGQDAMSSNQCNQLYVHVDPHAIAVGPTFSLTLQAPAGTQKPPYNQYEDAAPGSTGDIWMGDDGGVYHATGAQTNYQPSTGMSTLATVNIAGMAVKGLAPALFFGTGDNGDFFSLDGGSTWGIPIDYCGDCDAWFTDPLVPNQAMGFMPYASGGGFYVFTNPNHYPDAASSPTDGTQFAHWVCPENCTASSSFWDRGFRPVVLTPNGSAKSSTLDYILIGEKADSSRWVFRKTNGVAINTPADWADPSKAGTYGPQLPACQPTACVDVVQASGGHAAPVLYAGDPDTGPGDTRPGSHSLALYKFVPGSQTWAQIVPSSAKTPATQAASNAHRFFADPYNPNVIYLLDDSAIKRSNDGGTTWQVDASLDAALTENHRFGYLQDNSVVKDIIFVADEPNTRFAVGNAGVFYTLDGTNWTRLLSTSALPSHPVAAYFDKISDPCDRALYVGMDGRGILRFDPIPAFSSPITVGIPGCSQILRLQ